MSENKRQFETRLTINHKARWPGICGIVAFSMTIYCKLTVESVYERILRSVNIWRCKKALMRSLRLKEHSRDLEYGKKKLLLTVVTLI